MDSVEATVRIIEAMLASQQCHPPLGATRGQTIQRDTMGPDNTQIDNYRQDFVLLFRTVHDSVSEANDPVVGANYTVIGAMIGAEDSVLEAEDSVFRANDSVLEAEDSVFRAEDSVLEAEDSVFKANDSEIGADDSVLGAIMEATEPSAKWVPRS